MRAYLVTVLVEFADGTTDHWSEGADETFSIASAVNEQHDNAGNGTYLLGYDSVTPNTFPKFNVITKEGGL